MDKVKMNDISFNDITEEELKKELDLQHERLLKGEVETMSIDEFKKKHQSKYEL